VQLQGTLYIVSAAQISFTRLEVAALLGRDYSDELLTSLYERTHGWPVALKLFTVAADRYKASPQALLATIAEVPDVAAYLTEQVMSYLTPSLETFLIVTSLPARITGDLANKLCERTDGERTLQQLEKDGLFIIRAEEGGGWYRYHDFFRDFLRKRLAQQSTFDVGVLHKRAAEWFLAARQLDDALKHSLQAGAWQLAIGILENEGGWHIALKHGGDVLHGVDAIPDAAMQPSLLARLTLVYLLLHFGQTDRARDTFEQLRADSDDFTHWRGETIAATVRAECHALEAIVIIDEERPLSVAFVEQIKHEARSVGARGRFVRILTDSGLAIYETTTPATIENAFDSRNRGLWPLRKSAPISA
jgi:ATP/maltotriose-dependent transcriptional regulator MalT